jgi:hypothetical protein
VNFSQIYALMRRHLVAIVVIFVLAVGMAWDIKSTPPTYAESANVVFVAPSANPYSSLSEFTGALVMSAFAMITTIQSQESQQEIREAGGTADFSVGVVNEGDEEYPYYGNPYVDLTTTSANPADVHRTFTIVIQSLRRLLSVRQAQAGVTPVNHIFINVVGDTGPVVQAGSPKRVFAGLIVLVVVTAFLIAIFLDRHPIWPKVHSRMARYPAPLGKLGMMTASRPFQDH